MPYKNVPEHLWDKMDRCVEKVKGQGGAKNAYAICYASVVGEDKKEMGEATIRNIVEKSVADAVIEKHYGPGPHKSGTPQSVHGGDGDGEKKKPAPKKKPVKRSKITGLPIREPKPKPKLDSERAVANWVHDEVGITGMTGKKKPFLTSLKRDKGGGYRVSTYRRRRLSLEYALRDMGFEPFKTDLRTKHFYDVSKGMDWRSDKFYVSLTEKKVASGEHMLDVEIHERRKAPPTIPQGKEISTVIEDRITA